MPSKRRKARESALKALYQHDLVNNDAMVALSQIIADDILQPALEAFSREFALQTIENETQTGEIERFIAEFSGRVLSEKISENQIESIARDLITDIFPNFISHSECALLTQNFIQKTISKIESTKEIENFARDLVNQTIRNLKNIDSILIKFADHWSLERMASIDRCILRFAICELLFFKSIPVNVTINEAIELSKKFSTERSGEFVNGILDKVQRELSPEKDDPRKRKGAAEKQALACDNDDPSSDTGTEKPS